MTLPPGYVFETVFWAQRGADGPRLLARNVKGTPVGPPIVCDDRRVPPGQRVKVRVDEATDDAVRVSFLGLVEFDLASGIYVDPDLLRQFDILLCSGRSILLESPHPVRPVRHGQAEAGEEGRPHRQPDSHRRGNPDRPFDAGHGRGVPVPELPDAPAAHDPRRPDRHPAQVVLQPAAGAVGEEGTEAHTAMAIIERNVLLNDAATAGEEDAP